LGLGLGLGSVVLLLLLLLIGRTDRGTAETTDRTSDESAGSAIAVTGDESADPGTDGSTTGGTFLSRGASDECEGGGEEESNEDMGLHGRETSLFLNK
jgi:hypothetical protein